MKRAFFFLAFFFASFSLVFADSKNKIKKPFSGIYIGGGLGASLLGGEYAYETTNGVGDSGKLNMRGFGLLMNATAGYMWLADSKAWFGGELYFNAKTAKSTKNMKNITDEGNVNIKNSSTFGVAGLVGSALNPKMVMYAKAGFEMGAFSFKYTKLTSAPAEKSVSKRIRAVVPGAGLMYSFSDSFLLGGEYGYMLSMKKLAPSDSDPKAEYKPTEHRLMATIRYIF